ncbi:MAG: tetratricopeptide repeat-containing sensor histidine kinase [Bacteroidota bacterium]
MCIFAQGFYSDAYDYYYKAKKAATDKFEACEMGDYNYRLGMVLYKQEKYAEAANYFKECYDQTSTCGDQYFNVFYRKQEVLNNTALSFFKNGHLDSALEYYNKAQKYITLNYKKYKYIPEDAYLVAQAVINGNMGSVYYSKKDYKTAEELFKESIDVNSKPGHDLNDGQLTKVKLANLYFDLGNYKSMLDVLTQTKTILDTLPNKAVEEGWNNVMWKYYSHEKQPEKAFNYLLKYSEIKDSISIIYKKLRDMDMTERVSSLEKQYQINILRKGNELKQLYLVIAVIVLLMSMVIGMLVLQNLNKSKYNVRVLKHLNDQVNEQKVKLENALAQLEIRNKEKDRILRAVAHDLMNPIAAISSLSDLVLFGSENLTDEQKEYLELIKSVCTNAITLSKEILEAATAIDPKTLEKAPISVNSLLKDCVDLLRFRAAEKNQKIDISLPDEAQELLLNKEKIWRAIGNIIGNAIKFSPESATICVGLRYIEDGALITIKDQGIGIPHAIKDKVFETFTEARRLGTSGEKPFGLGLSISRQVVEAHGGKIWFESELGNGTTFYIYLPQNAIV